MNTLKTILLLISIVVTNDGWRRSTCPLAHPNHPTTPTSTQNYHQQTCDNLYNPNPPQFTTTFTNPHNYSSRPHDDGRHPAATPRENRTTCWYLPQPVERSQEPTVGPLETKDSRPASLPPKQAGIWIQQPSVPKCIPQPNPSWPRAQGTVPAVNRKEVPPSTERRHRRQPKGGTICQVVAPRSDYLPGPSERSAQGTGHRKEHEKSNTSHTVWTQIFARRSPCKILQTTVTVPPVRYQLPGSRYRQEHYLPVPSERIAQGAGFRKEHDKSNTSTTVWTQIFARRSPSKILQTTVTVPPVDTPRVRNQIIPIRNATKTAGAHGRSEYSFLPHTPRGTHGFVRRTPHQGKWPSVPYAPPLGLLLGGLHPPPPRDPPAHNNRHIPYPPAPQPQTPQPKHQRYRPRHTNSPHTTLI